MGNTFNSFDTDNVKSKGKKFLALFMFLTIILTISCVILTWQLLEFRHLAKDESAAKTEAILAKENLLLKLKNLELQYDELSDEYAGFDSLFIKEKTKIATLKEEIKNLKGSAADYQAKVKELEKRLSEYAANLSKIKINNEILVASNIRIKNTLDSIINRDIEAELKDQTPAEKIISQSALKAGDIISEAIRINSKNSEAPTRVAKNVQKIKISFTISENKYAIKGTKIIYVRIAEPGNAILSNSGEDTFIFKGKSLNYSVKKEIYFSNNEQDICIYWEKIKELIKGVYYVDIFADDNLLGTSTFVLE